MNSRRLYLLLVVFLVLAVYSWTVCYRLEVANKLKFDFDEPIYTRVASDLAPCIYSFNTTCLTSYRYNYEHPMLGKIIYGLFLNSNESFEEKIMVARRVDVYLSSITSAVLTLFNPLAGILYSGDALVTKYSSQAYLDALATLFTTLSYLLIPVKRSTRFKTRIALSGLFAGAAVATKYTALPALIPIPLYLVARVFVDSVKTGDRVVVYRVFKPVYTAYLLLWLILGSAVFIASNPMFWSDLGKSLNETMLYKSLLFHREYAYKTSYEHPLPPYYQFVWIVEEAPLKWHPGVIWLNTGLLILVLGYLGLPLVLARKPLIGGWIVSYTLFLILWPVKWPQYNLLLLAPLSISASYTIYYVFHALRVASSKLKDRRLYALFSITVLTVSTPLLAEILPQSRTETGAPSVIDEYLEKKMLNNSKYVVLETKSMRIVFDREGFKPVSWRIEGFELLRQAGRGRARAVPYEWIPRNKFPWPGEIYYSEFKVYRFKNYIVAYTRLEKDVENLLLYKYVRVVNDTCLEIKYELFNPTDHALVVESDPSWRVDWGFSVELTIAPINSIENISQYYVTCDNSTIYTRMTWTAINDLCVSRYGLRSGDDKLDVYIVNYNRTDHCSLWLEYGDKWISIRLSYPKTRIEPGSRVVYKTMWCTVYSGSREKLNLSLYQLPLKTTYIFTYVLIMLTCLAVALFKRDTIEFRR